VYEDEKLGSGKKSYAISLIFLDENKTLTDDTVDKVIVKLTKQFESELNAQIRK
jgi:phenylalanyl-tRNA synthetase beta chain